MATRWGICGSGNICNDFCVALQILPQTEHQIVAVAASSKERADQFAQKFGIPDSYGSYDELATNPNVDVVYIGVVHTRHVDLCLKYINAGKNVLCEKPMALSLEGCRSVLSAAKEKGVLFVEATWSRFFPVYDLIREHLDSGALGEVKMVSANFSTKNDHVARVIQPELGGGALMDIGIYPVQAANLVFKGKPEQISISATKSETGVDLLGVVTLRYSGGRYASLTYCSQTKMGANFLIIRGSKGNLQIPDFLWCPTEVILPDGQRKEFPLNPKNADKFNYDNGQGMMYEAMGVRECLLKGLKESPKMPHEDSEMIMTILDECLTQMNIKYQFP